MTWRDNLIDGLLDGVPFEYRSVSASLGRRTEVTEFPGRDDPFTEDMGRLARRFTIEAFVIGDNYMSFRDALIEVIEAPGDKVFSNPYRGDFGVKVDGECRLVEKDTEGGMAKFTIPLVEAGTATPNVALLTVPTLGLLVPDLQAKLPSTKFNLLNAIGAVLQSITNALNAATGKMLAINGKIAGALNLVDNLSAALDGFAASIGTLLNTPQALLSELTQLANSVLNLVNTFRRDDPTLDITQPLPPLVDIAMAATEDFFGFGAIPDGIPTPTPQSVQEQEGVAAINRTFRAAGVSAGISVVSQLPLDSAQQARDIADNFREKLDTLIDLDFEPIIQESLLALKAGMVEHFAREAQQLPSITTTKVFYAEPALVMAYRLYKQSTLDEDIIARNGLRHPAFIPAGADIEILSSATPSLILGARERG